MNPSHKTAIDEYQKGNFPPLIRALRNKLKNDPELCEFVMLIVQRKVKLKRGKKGGKNEKRDRQLAALLMKHMRVNNYWDALQAVKDETGLSEGTIQRAYRKYPPARTSRPRS